VLALLIGCIAFVSFAYALSAQFTNYDDPWQITENPSIRSLSPGNLWHIITRPIYNIWLPTKTLSYALDYRLWGLDPRGFHASSVLWHALASVLVFLLALKFLQGPGWAVAAGLFFAVLPVHVEAVAWLSARKDVLSTVFVVASTLAFLRWRDRRGRYRLWYGLSLVAFLCASRAKPTAHVLPALLLVLDRVLPEQGQGGGKSLLRSWWLLRGTLPFFLLAGVMTAMDWKLATSYGYATAGALGSPGAAVYVVGRSYLKYVGLLLYPVNMSVQYAPWKLTGLLDWLLLLCGLVLLAASIGFVVWGLIRRQPVGAALGWFVVAVLPVCGLIPISVPSPVADRYLYLPSVGACILAGRGLEVLWLNLAPVGRKVLVAAVTVIIVVFGVQTWVRSGVWRDSKTLWSSELAHNPGNHNAHVNLGEALFAEGKLDAAREHYLVAAKLAPGLLHAYQSIGAIDAIQGNYAAARKWLTLAVTSPPAPVLTRPKILRARARAYRHLGNVDELTGRLTAAADFHRAAIRLSEEAQAPVLAESARKRLARVTERMRRAETLVSAASQVLEQGKRGLAERYLREAVVQQPDNGQAALLLARLLSEDGRLEEALEVVEEGLARVPTEPALQEEKAKVLEAIKKEQGSSQPTREPVPAPGKE